MKMSPWLGYMYFINTIYMLVSQQGKDKALIFMCR